VKLMVEPSPLQRYLLVQVQSEHELDGVLRDAMADARRRLTSLAGRSGLGAEVRSAQLRQSISAMRKVQAELWGEAGRVVQSGRVKAAVAASEAEQAATRALWNLLGGPIKELEIALQAQAASTVDTLAARAANNIPLSDQVFKTAAQSSGLVDRAINRSILQGDSWKEMADRVTGLINPNVPGGVSYSAKRLGRTELNNAFHRQQIDEADDSPFVSAVQWHLSGSHRHSDACDTYAHGVHVPGGGQGVFATGEVPPKPHPQCFCFLTTVHVGEDEFVEGFLNGRYDKYIDDKVYKYAPELAPC
jgi:hypothetical protein